jgi:apyrase
MWLTVNYLLQNILPSPALKTALTIDVGGASTQIAFKPQSKSVNSTFDIDLQIPNFNEYDIYSTSYLGFGNDVARNNIVLKSDTGKDIISTPCFHLGYSGQWEADSSKTIQGTG